MRKTIEFLIDNNFDPRSTAILANSLIYHRAAIETRTPENQLLDLWASLEGFLPPPRGDKRTRIDHYVENILPPLTLTYCFKVFTYLAESIKHAGKNIVEIVESIPIDGDFFYKSVAIISCDEFSDQGREICKHLDDFPLLKFRLFRSNQRFNSSLSIYNEIIEHRQLVSWHLQRIYTARNQIIHTANSLPYLRKLVENIHYYVDILIKSMMKIASDYDSPLDITSSTRLLISHEEQYLKTLKNINTKCNKDNFKQILFGENNPLYPL